MIATVKVILVMLGMGMFVVGVFFVLLPPNAVTDRTRGAVLIGGGLIVLTIAAGIHGFEGG